MSNTVLIDASATGSFGNAGDPETGPQIVRFDITNALAGTVSYHRVDAAIAGPDGCPAGAADVVVVTQRGALSGLFDARSFTSHAFQAVLREHSWSKLASDWR